MHINYTQQAACPVCGDESSIINRTTALPRWRQPYEEVPLSIPAPKRLVSVGDLHGDFPKALRAFRLAGLCNEKGEWTGGDTVCVQVSVFEVRAADSN